MHVPYDICTRVERVQTAEIQNCPSRLVYQHPHRRQPPSYQSQRLSIQSSQNTVESNNSEQRAGFRFFTIHSYDRHHSDFNDRHHSYPHNFYNQSENLSVFDTTVPAEERQTLRCGQRRLRLNGIPSPLDLACAAKFISGSNALTLTQSAVEMTSELNRTSKTRLTAKVVQDPTLKGQSDHVRAKTGRIRTAKVSAQPSEARLPN